MKKIFLFAFVIVVLCSACSRISNKKIGAPCDSKLCIGAKYSDVVSIFKEAGFSDVKITPVDDIKLGIFAKENEVFEVTIALQKNFKKDDAFFTNDPVRIKYHCKPKSADKK